jgi:hypothetical protein
MASRRPLPFGVLHGNVIKTDTATQTAYAKARLGWQRGGVHAGVAPDEGQKLAGVDEQARPNRR